MDDVQMGSRRWKDLKSRSLITNILLGAAERQPAVLSFTLHKSCHATLQQTQHAWQHQVEAIFELNLMWGSKMGKTKSIEKIFRMYCGEHVTEKNRLALRHKPTQTQHSLRASQRRTHANFIRWHKWVCRRSFCFRCCCCYKLSDKIGELTTS